MIERLPKPLHASVRRALRQAWELDDADKAERLMRNLARRLDQEAPGVAASILEGLDEMLTVIASDCRQSCGARSPAPTHREHDGHRAARLSQREAMAKCRDGAALDGGRHDGSGQGLPPIESLQAAPNPQSCACRSRCRTRRHQED